MPYEFSRTELLIGPDALKKLSLSRVAVFGIGGVGSYTAETLARAGIGAIDLIDNDIICLTNINRQLHATHKTIGKYKSDVMRDRLLEINPAIKAVSVKEFFSSENADRFFSSTDGGIDYIVDAIDTVSSKLELVVQAQKRGIPIISCMGAGNKLDPTKFEVTDIYKTSVCPLAKVMRHELRRRGVEKLKVVYSREMPVTPIKAEATSLNNNCVCPENTERKFTERRQVPGSISFVPSVAGIIISGEVIKDIIGANA